MPERPLLTWVKGSVRTTARLTDTTLPDSMAPCCPSAPVGRTRVLARSQPVEQAGRDDRDRRTARVATNGFVALDVRDLRVAAPLVRSNAVSAPSSAGSTIQYDGTPMLS